MNTFPVSTIGLSQLLTPVLTGPDAEFAESQLLEIFGPTAANPPQDGASLDDCLGQRRACLVCMVPRSGSSYLSTLMRSTERLGTAAEFLNLADTLPGLTLFRCPAGCGPLRSIVKEYRLGSLTEYLRHIVHYSSSPNGIFSIKGDFYQFLPLLRRGLLRRGLQKVTFVYTTREDILAQAVSAFRAVRTGSWSCLQPARAQAEFDAEGILQQLQRIVRLMAQWETLFALLDIHPLRLSYEQISAEPTEAVHQVAAALGVSLGSGPPESPLRQQRDGTSAEWMRRIRTAAADCIAEISARPRGAALPPAAAALPTSAPPGLRNGRFGLAWLKQWLKAAT